jgi:hypothetical protein
VREFLVDTIVAGQKLTDRIAQLRSDGQDPMVYRPVTLLPVAAAHFHTLRSLVIDAEVSHSFAPFGSFVPFSVVRTALESAATALSLLGPGDRTERIVRGLRLELTDREDFDRAVSHRHGAHPARAIKEYRKEMLDLARQATGDRTVELTKVWTTSVLDYAATETPSAGDVVGAWQMCSAFAHGRSWPAGVVFPRTEGHPGEPPGDVSWVALAHVVGCHTPRHGQGLGCLSPGVTTPGHYVQGLVPRATRESSTDSTQTMNAHGPGRSLPRALRGLVAAG